jgi:hypothetical protein
LTLGVAGTTVFRTEPYGLALRMSNTGHFVRPMADCKVDDSNPRMGEEL